MDGDLEGVLDLDGDLEGVLDLDGDLEGVLDLEGVTDGVTVLDFVGLLEGVIDCVSSREGVFDGDTDGVLVLEGVMDGDTDGVLDLEGDFDGVTDVVLDIEGDTDGVTVLDFVGLPEALFDIIAIVTDLEGVTVRLPDDVTDLEGVFVGLPDDVTEDVCELDGVTVADCVKGRVVGIPDRVSVPELEGEIGFVVGCPVLVIEYVDEDDTEIVYNTDAECVRLAKGVGLEKGVLLVSPDCVLLTVPLTVSEEVGNSVVDAISVCIVDTDIVGVLLPLCEKNVSVALTDLLGVCDAHTV